MSPCRLVCSCALMLAAAGCAVPTSPAVGATQAPIVDGVRETGRPEVVFLWNTAGSACTATVIAPRLVLTAKHCVRQGQSSSAAPASQFRIFVGTDGSSFTKQYFVSEVRVAPGRWDLRDSTDVALLILASPASEPPMEISYEDPRTIIGQTYTAVGYGQTPRGGSGTKYTTNKVVQNVQNGFVFVEPAVCSGDSGGPLIGPNGKIYGVASFIFSPDGRSQPSCGTAPGAYNSLQRFQAFIEQALEDSGTCVPSEEICNSLDDDCDGRVDEVCTPLGEGCTADDQCVGQTCATTGGARICTLDCDPLRPTLGCPMGMYCAKAEGCGGYCTPGAAGTLAVGEDCTADTDCATTYCVDPGDGRQRCLPPCEGDRGLCLAGEVCAASAGVCGGCVARDIVVGRRGIGEPCEADDECLSVLCLDDEGARYCTRSCEDSSACVSGFHCRAGSCIRGPLEGTGGGCVTNEDCVDGICASRGDGLRWCTRFCTTTDDCPSGLSCTTVGEANICAPDLGLVGQECATNEECTSGLCALGTPSGDICSRFCGADAACSPGFECTRIGDGTSAVCVPASVSSGGGGCAVRGASSRSVAHRGLGGLLLLGLGLFWLRRRRR
ncbi:MAG: S1 family peptidase [Deltaproteobacteria bacterium]|nr:S1 family peptidase [Deltaproteobacteria bacterium]